MFQLILGSPAFAAAVGEYTVVGWVTLREPPDEDEAELLCVLRDGMLVHDDLDAATLDHLGWSLCDAARERSADP